MGPTTDSSTNILPQLCNNNCGFFGNTLLDGFCSQCYSKEKKKSIDKENEHQGQQDTPVEMHEEELVIESKIIVSSPVKNLSLSNQSQSVKKCNPSRKVRCPSCKKIMGILQYPCVCGGHFCSNCRYSNEHQCPIDYKTIERKILAKNNPQVIADRVQNRQ